MLGKKFYLHLELAPGKIVVVNCDVMSDFISSIAKLPLTIDFFWAPTLCKTTFTLLHNKLIFVLVRISVFPTN